MNLHQFVITEMTGPVPYELTLGEIIRDGDVTNPYQTYVLSLLTQSIKAGLPVLGGSLPIYVDGESTTSSTAIDAIKSLSPTDKVTLAQCLLDALQIGALGSHMQFMSSADWSRFVLQRNQD